MKYLIVLLLILQGCKPPQVYLDSPEEFVIAFGSCNHQWDPQIIWAEVIANNPNLWVWTGDIIYADTEDMTKMNKDYQMLKSNAHYQNLLVQCPVVGIWDDHDYGSNNSGKEYPMKDESKKALLDFLDVSLDNPVYNRDGVYQAYDYTIGSLHIKLILLDVRYFRDRIDAEHASILGVEQWTWLEQQLSQDADINLIAGGIQFLHTEHRYEKWSNYPREYDRLIELLSTSEAKNPVLISGDRHIGEIAALTLADGRKIYEITSSGLTHSYEQSTESNSLRIGPLITTINFGVMRITNEDINLELHNANNQIVSHHLIPLNDTY